MTECLYSFSKLNLNRFLLFPRQAYIKETVRLYAGDTSIDQPYLSPLKGNLSGLPPMLVQVCGRCIQPF
jgi:acetyl esterase/lipase